MKSNPDGSVEFVVKGKWTFRSVACRIAQCVGITPLAWDENEDGAPFWRPDASDFGGGSFDLGNNDWWLRQVRVEKDETSGKAVMVYKLDFRYGRMDHRQEALKALATWLECDLVFGR